MKTARTCTSIQQACPYAYEYTHDPSHPLRYRWSSSGRGHARRRRRRKKALQSPATQPEMVITTMRMPPQIAAHELEVKVTVNRSFTHQAHQNCWLDHDSRAIATRKQLVVQSLRMLPRLLQRRLQHRQQDHVEFRRPVATSMRQFRIRRQL